MFGLPYEISGADKNDAFYDVYGYWAAKNDAFYDVLWVLIFRFMNAINGTEN